MKGTDIISFKDFLVLYRKKELTHNLCNTLLNAINKIREPSNFTKDASIYFRGNKIENLGRKLFFLN